MGEAHVVGISYVRSQKVCLALVEVGNLGLLGVDAQTDRFTELSYLCQYTFGLFV